MCVCVRVRHFAGRPVNIISDAEKEGIHRAAALPDDPSNAFACYLQCL